MIKYRRNYTCEKHVKEDVKKIFKHYGVWYFMPSMNGYGRSGVPDFIACVDGVFHVVETKFGGNSPTANQRREMEAICAAGGCVMVVDENNLDCLENAISALVGGR